MRMEVQMIFSAALTMKNHHFIKRRIDKLLRLNWVRELNAVM